MSETTCKMEFEVAHGSYRPGEIIKGSAILTINGTSVLFIKALSLQFIGYACTRWEKPQKTSKSSRNKPNVFIVNREDYISATNYLIGSELANPKPLVPGVYTYNFMVQIPENIPSTFESAYGAIRYELMINADYGNDTITLFNTPIQIEQLKDLRLMDQSVQLTKELQQIESKSCIKFWQQPLQLHVTLPQTAYVSGESVSVQVKLINLSKLKLKSITSNLNRIITYKGPLSEKNSQCSTEIITIASNMHNLYGQNSSVLQHIQELSIPKTPASMTFDECKCISIAYELEVLVTCVKKKRWVRATMPIIMGSISLQSNVKILPINQPHTNVASITVARSLDELNLPASIDVEYDFRNLQANQTSLSMNSLASSSFQEAEFMTAVKLNKKAKNVINDFKPKYLYYNMSQESPMGSIDGLASTTPELR